jgi:hypothetical protein
MKRKTWHPSYRDLHVHDLSMTDESTLMVLAAAAAAAAAVGSGRGHTADHKETTWRVRRTVLERGMEMQHDMTNQRPREGWEISREGKDCTDSFPWWSQLIGAA